MTSHGSPKALPQTPAPQPTTAANPTTTNDNRNGHGLSEEAQIALVRALRREVAEKYRPAVESQPSPIRLMARMVKEVESTALKQGISPEIVSREVVNRTIGDVNVRFITEKIDGVDYSTIGEDLGLILPGEQIGGRTSDGAVHRELNRRMEQIELRLLRDYNWDMRVYDVFGVGNPLLREMLAERFSKAWGLPTDPEQTFISTGALDALCRSILAFSYYFKKQNGVPPTFAFPAPGFAVVNWQVEAFGCKLMMVHTSEEDRFKLTYDKMKSILAEDPQLRLLYLTVSNNPTAFSYSAEELREVYRAINEDGREMAVLADLAYVGTGRDDEDRARMAGFNSPDMLSKTLFVNSLSKVFTLTGDRCGWVSLQNSDWADLLKVAWNNTTAGLPAEWQLRFTAYIQWFDEHPEIQQKIKMLYELRRNHLREQLHELNSQYDLFDEIGLDDHTTIYNWSKLKPGEDALTLFAKTGIAGVSGGAFGYDDEYIRLSVGFIPIR